MIQHLEELVSPVHVIKHNGEVLYSSTTRRINNELYTDVELRQQFMNYLFQLDDPLYLANSRRYAGLLFSNGDYLLLGPVMWINAPKLSCSSPPHLGAAWRTLPRAKKSSYMKALGDDFDHNNIDPIIKDANYLQCIKLGLCLLEQSVLTQALKLRVNTNAVEWSSLAVYMLPSTGLQEYVYDSAKGHVAEAIKSGAYSKQKTFDLYAIYDTEVLMECAVTSSLNASSQESTQNYAQESACGCIQKSTGCAQDTSHHLSDKMNSISTAVDILQNDLAVSDGSVNLQNLEAAKQQLLAHHDTLPLDVEDNKDVHASAKNVLQSADKSPIQGITHVIIDQETSNGSKACLEQSGIHVKNKILPKSKALLESKELSKSRVQAESKTQAESNVLSESTEEIKSDVNSLPNTENESKDNEPVRQLTLAELANVGDNALRDLKNKFDKQRTSSALKARQTSHKSLSALVPTTQSQDATEPTRDIVKLSFRAATDKSSSKDQLAELKQLVAVYQLELNVGRVVNALEYQVTAHDTVICQTQIKYTLDSGNEKLTFMHSSMQNQFLPGDMLSIVRSEQSLNLGKQADSNFVNTNACNETRQTADESSETVISDDALHSKKLEQSCLLSKNSDSQKLLFQGKVVSAEQQENVKSSSALKELSPHVLQQSNLTSAAESFTWSDKLKEQEQSPRMPTLSLESLANGENSELTGDIWAYCKGRERRKSKDSNKHTGFKAAASKNAVFDSVGADTVSDSTVSKNTVFDSVGADTSSDSGRSELHSSEVNVTSQSVNLPCNALPNDSLQRTADNLLHAFSKTAEGGLKTTLNQKTRLSQKTTLSQKARLQHKTTLNEELADDIFCLRCSNLSHAAIDLCCIQDIVSNNVVVSVGGLHIFMSRGEFLARELLSQVFWISEQGASTSKGISRQKSSQQFVPQQINSCLSRKANEVGVSLNKARREAYETMAWRWLGVQGQLSGLFVLHGALLAAWGIDIEPLISDQVYQLLQCIYIYHNNVSAFDNIAQSALQQNNLHPANVEAHSNMLSKLSDNELEQEINDITSIYYYAAEYLACAAVIMTNPQTRTQMLARVQTRGLSDSFYERAEDVSSDSVLKDEAVRNERIKAINVLLKTYFEVSRAVSEDNTPIDRVALKEFLSSSVIGSKHLPLQQVLSTETPHNAYSYELKHLQAITDGQPELALRALRSPMHGEEGRMGFTPLRHAKNSAIINATLDARAAIRGGVRVETAYTMADYMILMSELCQTVEEAVKLREECTYRFAELVQQSKQKKKPKYSVMVSRLLEEMERSIFVKVSREDLVACVSRNEDYVQRVFKEEVGESLMEHMRRIRIDRAKDLIVNSDIKISELAELLQFSSTSHFARVFKSFEGVSPAEYKAKHYAKQMHR